MPTAPKAPKRQKGYGPNTQERRRRSNLSYWAIGWLGMAHLVVLAAPFYFTWTGLIVALVFIGLPAAWAFASDITGF